MAALWGRRAGATEVSHAGAFRTIGWNDLVPRGWDPQHALRDLPGDIADLQDADPRAKALLDELRRQWDEAPLVQAMAGADVRLPGYLVPLQAGKAGVREFLLVPYFGACVHSPPPPANQIVLCRSARPLPGLRVMEAVWARGRLEVGRHASPMGVAGYAMRVASAERQV